MTTLDRSHDPARRSWIAVANGHRDFPIQNLPFGVHGAAGHRATIVVAIGDLALVLGEAMAAG